MLAVSGKVAERSGHHDSSQINFIKKQALVNKGIHIIHFQVRSNDNPWFLILSQTDFSLLRSCNDFSLCQLLINRLYDSSCLCLHTCANQHNTGQKQCYYLFLHIQCPPFTAAVILLTRNLSLCCKKHSICFFLHVTRL